MKTVTCRNCDLDFGIQERSMKAAELIRDTGCNCPYCGIDEAVLGNH